MEALGKVELEEAFFHSFQYFERDARFGTTRKSERPDFLITAEDKVIGVEVTALYTRDREVAAEHTKDEITSLSQAEATKLGLPLANVMLFFSTSRPLVSKKRKDVAAKVASTVGLYMPDSGDQVSLEMKPGQPSEVDLIMIDRSSDLHGQKWRWMEASIVMKDTHSLLQAAIDKKSAKLSEYLENCDECWLLAGVNSFRPSGKIRPENLERHAFFSQFHRTYFLDYGRGKLTRLNTIRRP